MRHKIVRKSMPMGEGAFSFTVDEMSKAAMGEFGAKSPKIRALALEIIQNAGVESHDTMGEIHAIHNWVRDSIHYVKDPAGVEFVTYPETLAFDTHAGDCDDHVTLEAALLGSIGIPSRFVIVQTPPNKTFNHVYMYAIYKDVLVPLDPIIKDKSAGWQVPNAIRRKVFPINTESGNGYLSDTALFGILLGVYRFLKGLD